MDDVVGRIAEIGIVPVIKLESAKSAVALARALAAGGIPVAEVTFRTDAAGEAIGAIRSEAPELLVGAGTVTSVELARTAIAAGARFVVSPGWDEEVVDHCLAAGVPVLPGVSGPDGIMRALAKGIANVKFFPAEVAGGVAMLDALSGPFPSVRYLPTGGIDASNLGSYAKRRQVLAVGGSWMARSDLIAAEDWSAIEAICREAVRALHGFAFAHVGLNGSQAGTASADAAALEALFGLAPKEGSSSIFASDALELLKAPYLGEHGHLALRCNDVERAVAYLAAKGVKTLPETERADKGRIKSIYLDLAIAGFAVHLLRA